MMRTHMCGELRPEHAGQEVSVCGWVASRREHGQNLAFVDVRDYSGLLQCVVDNTIDVRSEYVVRITGVVRARPEGTVNSTIATGEVEVGDHPRLPLVHVDRAGVHLFVVKQNRCNPTLRMLKRAIVQRRFGRGLAEEVRRVHAVRAAAVARGRDRGAVDGSLLLAVLMRLCPTITAIRNTRQEGPAQ